MYYLTYNLKADSEKSDLYYSKVKYSKEEIMNSLFNTCREHIEDFSMFISRCDIEKLRSYEEYFIELLLIGVLKSEYEQYIDTVGRMDILKFNLLNKLRRHDLLKVKVDELRGNMNSGILLKKEEKHCNNDLNIKN